MNVGGINLVDDGDNEPRLCARVLLGGTVVATYKGVSCAWRASTHALRLIRQGKPATWIAGTKEER